MTLLILKLGGVQGLRPAIDRQAAVGKIPLVAKWSTRLIGYLLIGKLYILEVL